MRTPSLRLDHVLTFTSVKRVEASLERYQLAGFVVSDHIARWEPGLRNGFVNLWPEYLELLCIDDSDSFANDAPDALRNAASQHRPFGLGFYSDDTVALHKQWAAKGRQITAPEMLRLATTSPDSPPDFCEMPVPELEGADCFVLTSYFPDAAMRRFMDVAPNTVFGLAGVTLVTERPDLRCRDWAALLDVEALVESPDEAFLHLGLHRFRWISEKQHESQYCFPWDSSGSEIAVLHLLAEDASLVSRMMSDAGWTVITSRSGCTTAHHPEDGFVFTVEEHRASDWQRSRKTTWGEALQLRDRFEPNSETGRARLDATSFSRGADAGVAQISTVAAS